MANKFVHYELSTENVAQAKGFYKKLFKWDFESAKGGMPYTMIRTGAKESGAGLQKKQMPEAPNAWLAYVEVDDVRKTMAKALKAGAHPIVEYMEVPGMGAFGIFSDPAGAALGVWEAAPKKKPARKKK